ncbi:MAG: O-antigen ligase family protein [Candidatus Thorarchaeota archaeon]
MAITLINFIKEKVDQKVIKLLIVISCYLVCYFYTIDKLPKNAWIVGAYIAISLPILLSFTNNNYVNIGIILIPLVSMFLCTSYTVAIASIGGIIGYFIFEKEYILCLILMLLLSILFFSLYRHKKIDVVYRLNLWSRSLKKADFTLFGDGLRLYKNYKFMAGQNTKTTHAHNEFIELYCELGLIGIMIVALYIISLFKIHAPNEYKAMLLAILIMCFGYYPLRIPSLGLLTIINIGIINKYKTKRRFANV